MNAGSEESDDVEVDGDDELVSGIGDEVEEGAVESDSNVRDGACVGVGGDEVDGSGSGDAETRGEGAGLSVVSEVDEEDEASEGLAAGACASKLVEALDAEAC